MKKIPYVIQQGNRKVLMVDDKPFIMLAGEVHNSNSSSIDCMDQVWNFAKGLLGSARERSAAADALFASRVLEEFVRYMKEHTSTMISISLVMDACLRIFHGIQKSRM